MTFGFGTTYGIAKSAIHIAQNQCTWSLIKDIDDAVTWNGVIVQMANWLFVGKPVYIVNKLR
jgi:hypothetical protein